MNRADLAYAAPGSYVIDTRTGEVCEKFPASRKGHQDQARGVALRLEAEHGRPFTCHEVLDLPDMEVG